LVASCKTKLDLLISAGVRPIIVFDGASLPAKLDVERER